jgi:drug/metabolite transporter (DMT)-like permease
VTATSAEAVDAGAERAPASAVRGTLLVVFAACCFGSISTLVVLATRGGDGGAAAPALATVLTWRYAVAAVLLAPLAWHERRRTGRGLPLTAGALARGIGVAGVGQVAVAGLSLSALRWIPVGTLGFLFYTFPAWVTLLAALRGSERLDRRRLLALALSFAGIACTVGLPGADGAAPGVRPWPGIALALAAAVAYALYIPYLGRLQARTSPTAASLLVCLGAGAGFALGARGDLAAPMPAQSWLMIAVLGVVCTVVAFNAFMRGLGRLGPVRTAIVSTVEPLWTAALGALVLAQPLGPATLVGGGLIAAAVALLQLAPAKR